MTDPGYLVATALDLSKRDNTAAWLEYWGIVVIGNHAVRIRVQVPYRQHPDSRRGLVAVQVAS